jgi:hypothetical protein
MAETEAILAEAERIASAVGAVQDSAAEIIAAALSAARTQARAPTEAASEDVMREASRVAAEIMGNDHLAHRLDEQQQDEVHGDIQLAVLRALLASEARGREKQKEADARIAEGADRNVVWTPREIAAAIRNQADPQLPENKAIIAESEAKSI